MTTIIPPPTTRPLTFEQLANIIATRPHLLPPLQIYYTPHATRDVTVTRPWKERLFTRPWHPWHRYKVEPHPAIYLVNIPSHRFRRLRRFPPRQCTIVIAHPSFQNEIQEALEGPP